MRMNVTSGEGLALPVWGPRLGVMALLVGLALLGFFGLTNHLRSAPWGDDFRWFYAGGLVWAEGAHPADPAAYAPVFEEVAGEESDTGVLPFPPQAAVPFIQFAALPYDWSVWVWAVLNMGGLFVLSRQVLGVVRGGVIDRRPRSVTVGFGDDGDVSWWQRRLSAASAPGAKWWVPALVAGTMPAWANVFQGQLAIWLAVGLLWVWQTSRTDGKWLVVGCVLGLMSIKPTVAVLLGLWFVLEKRWRTLGVSAAVALLLAAYGMWQIGPVQAFGVWLESLAHYRNSVHNEVGSFRVLGLQSLLAAYGVPVPGLGGWLALASLCTVLLFYFRGRGRVLAEDVFPLLMGLHVLLLFAHPYELILLAPMVASYWLHLRGGRVVWMVLALALAGLVSVPERVMQSAGLLWVDHWRTLTVAALWGWLLVMSVRASRRVGESQAHEEEGLPVASPSLLS